MRWTLALLTTIALSSSALAQSVRPAIEAARPQLALAPYEMPVATAAPSAVGQPTAATTSTSLAPSPGEPTAALVGPAPAAADPRQAGLEQRLGKPVRASERPATTLRSSSERRVEQRYTAPIRSTYEARPHAPRYLGRFHPPVF